MINVLYIINHAEKLGGAEINLLQIIKHIDRTCFKPILLVYKEGLLSQQAQSLNTQVIVMPFCYLRRTINPFLFMEHLFKLAVIVLKLIRVFNKYKINIVHVHDVNSAIFAGFAAKIKKVKFIWHIHTLISNLGLIGNIMFSLADKIIFVSEFQRKKASQNAWKKYYFKTKVIYNGIDFLHLDRLKTAPTLKNELAIPKDTIIIGAAGRITIGKCYEDIIEAAKIVLDKYNNVEFIIVGDVTHFDLKSVRRDEKYLEQLHLKVKNLNIDKKVKFVGFRKDILQVLKMLDIFIFPSVVDSFGRVIIEAMGCKTAVIAANFGAVSEIIKNDDSGIIVPAQAPKALGQAILNLLEDKQKLDFLINNAYREVHRRFNSRNLLSEIFALYEN
ncbi:MAG: glycosyltransferase family 4 protein [Candidatus Omnitrophica bacterium]|nr:glycosyltransferase family 4 protein [Candidatus Omnitrophota bacterium]